MFNLLRWLASWIVRHLLIFALIVVAMAAFVQIKAAFDRVPALQQNVATLEQQKALLDVEADGLRRWADGQTAWIDRAGHAERGLLVRRLVRVRSDLAEPANRPRSGVALIAEAGREGVATTAASNLRAAFAQQLREREAAAITGRLAMMDRQVSLTEAFQSRRQAEARIGELTRAIEAVEQRRFINTPVIRHLRGGAQLDAWRNERSTLLRQRADRERAQRHAQATFNAARENYGALLVGLRAARPPDDLDRALQRQREELAQHWATRIWDAVRPVLLWALWVLGLVILVPPTVKAFWFFVIAPLAARLDPIRLRPHLGGAIDWAAARVAGGGSPSGSAVSREVVLRPGEELLIKPEYLQSAINEARIDTRFVLSRQLFFGSLATGLVNLTRIRVDREASVTVSATQDLVDEVAVIEIAEGSALVFQPRNLVGLIQRGDRPLRIEKVWRAGHLSSWLTLRLRHLVFHGPCALIVKGARGVALEPATSGRRIAGAATMGWSANLAWSVRRSETFHAYRRGKQSLFNDSFDGPDGQVVYEQMPRAGAKAGWWARGLEGVGDGLLKVVGL